MNKLQSRHSSIQVIDRAVALLSALSLQRQDSSLKDLSLLTNLKRSTACRILDALQVHGYVKRVSTGIYRIGQRANEDLPSVAPVTNTLAIELMTRIMNAVHETVSLGVLSDGYHVITHCVGPARAPFVDLAEGSKIPLHASAAGKLWLGEQGPASASAYVKKYGLSVLTPYTLKTEEGLLHKVRRARKRGYGQEWEESTLGTASIAVLLPDQTALTLHAPRSRLDKRWADILKAHALLYNQRLQISNVFPLPRR